MYWKTEVFYRQLKKTTLFKRLPKLLFIKHNNIILSVKYLQKPFKINSDPSFSICSSNVRNCHYDDKLICIDNSKRDLYNVIVQSCLFIEIWILSRHLKDELITIVYILHRPCILCLSCTHVCFPIHHTKYSKEEI